MVVARTRLDDEAVTVRAGVVAWRTFWELTWDEHPDAVAYEVRTITSEGASPRLSRQHDRRVRIEVASGEDTTADQPARRRMLLAMQRGQLALQVRAVLPDDTVTPWSLALAVGEEAAG